MLSLENLLPRLIPQVPGCPNPPAIQALRDAAIEFCERSRVLRVTMDPVLTHAGTAEYDLDLPPGTELSMLVAVWVGGRPVPLLAEPYRAPLAGGFGASPGTDPGTLRLTPAPAEGGVPIVVRAAVRPTFSATSVPRELEVWHDALVAGAVGRLAVIPGQPFTSPTMAVYAAQVFAAALSRARVEAVRDRTPGDLRVSARPFV